MLAVITVPMSSGVPIQPSRPNMNTIGKKLGIIETIAVAMPAWTIVITTKMMPNAERKLSEQVVHQRPLHFVHQRHDAGEMDGDAGGRLVASPSVGEPARMAASIWA